MKWARPTYFFGVKKIVTSQAKIVETVRGMVDPILLDSGYDLVDVEYLRGPGGMVLRLIIDKPGGVTIDDCADVSHLVGDLLDVEDPIPCPYNLEVSSPGINRPLKKPQDFKRFAGQKVYVQTSEPVEGRRRFKGILLGMEQGEISLEAGDRVWKIPLECIRRARLDII